ncbi:MAG TPA: N-acetylmuramoyl-L-alanine amidase [Sphingobium sp.]|nr:N-acetylmuramoyl-L-alanine amidase [Sphingobium sp.]
MLALLAALLAPDPAPAIPLPVASPKPWDEAHMARRPPRSRGITVAIPDAAPAIGLPPIEGPRDPERPLVVIDAGHGGHDPGAINPNNGWREKDVTLDMARALRHALLRTGRIRVALTRDDDQFLILQERHGIAQRLKADLFISIHADASTNADARGASIYTLSEIASDREAARLAARENKADVLDGINLSRESSRVSSILIDLAQRDTMAVATRFADILRREAGPYMTFQPPAHRFASLVVLKSPEIPSVLLETGYISNDTDGRMLISPWGQRRIARGIAKAITVHFARMTAR